MVNKKDREGCEETDCCNIENSLVILRKKYIYTKRVFKHCGKLARFVMEFPFLEIVRTLLNMKLYIKLLLFELEQTISTNSSHPILLYNFTEQTHNLTLVLFFFPQHSSKIIMLSL